MCLFAVIYCKKKNSVFIRSLDVNKSDYGAQSGALAFLCTDLLQRLVSVFLQTLDGLYCTTIDSKSRCFQQVILFQAFGLGKKESP